MTATRPRAARAQTIRLSRISPAKRLGGEPVPADGHLTKVVYRYDTPALVTRNARRSVEGYYLFAFGSYVLVEAEERGAKAIDAIVLPWSPRQIWVARTLDRLVCYVGTPTAPGVRPNYDEEQFDTAFLGYGLWVPMSRDRDQLTINSMVRHWYDPSVQRFPAFLYSRTPRQQANAVRETQEVLDFIQALLVD
jgi:hypothetical protein